MSGRWRFRALCLGAMSVGAARASAAAQASPDSTSRSTPDSSSIITRRDVFGFAGAVLSTAAVAPFDRDVQHAAYRADSRHRGLARTADALAFTGGPGPFVVGGALYVVGLTTESFGVARVGVTLTEGVVLAAGLNGVVKGFAGRALPNAHTPHPGHFSFGRGFHDGNGPFVSFPSGHTAASFAAAAVLSDESSAWGPAASRLVPPAAYTVAAMVAVSRLYDNQHWASDLPLGAAIGIWSGKTVAHWQRRHPDNWLSRHLLGLDVVPGRHTLMVGADLPLGAP